jgi:hypothetical protein
MFPLHAHAKAWQISQMHKQKGQKDRNSKTSQLSRTNDFSFGHPPPSLKTSQIELVKDSQSVRSISCKLWHCNANVARFSCFCNANFCKSRNKLQELLH